MSKQKVLYAATNKSGVYLSSRKLVYTDVMSRKIWTFHEAAALTVSLTRKELKFLFPKVQIKNEEHIMIVESTSGGYESIVLDAK